MCLIQGWRRSSIILDVASAVDQIDIAQSVTHQILFDISVAAVLENDQQLS